MNFTEPALLKSTNNQSRLIQTPERQRLDNETKATLQFTGEDAGDAKIVSTVERYFGYCSMLGKIQMGMALVHSYKNDGLFETTKQKLRSLFLSVFEVDLEQLVVTTNSPNYDIHQEFAKILINKKFEQIIEHVQKRRSAMETSKIPHCLFWTMTVNSLREHTEKLGILFKEIQQIVESLMGSENVNDALGQYVLSDVMNLSHWEESNKVMNVLFKTIEEMQNACADNWEIVAVLEKGKKDIAFEDAFDFVCLQQSANYRLDKFDSIEQRIGYARSRLSVNNSTGIHILAELSTLDTPMAQNARDELNKWLDNPKYRLTLIDHYSSSLAKYKANDPNSEQVRTQLVDHIQLLLQQVQKLNKEGNTKEAQQLIFQLIDVTIPRECDKPQSKNVKVASLMYECLLASPDVDSNYKEELTVRKRRNDSGLGYSMSDFPKCIIDAANTPGRPNAAYQVAKICSFFIYDNDGKVKRDPDTFLFEWAPYIPMARHYFTKASNEGCLLLKGDLDALANAITATIKQAEDYCSRSNKWYEGLRLYHAAGIAGDPYALLQYCLLYDPDMKDPYIQFKHGKLLLDGSKAVKQNIEEAQKRLEFAANNGIEEAAILVAQHYSPNTPHKPKFVPSYTLKNSDEKAMQYLEIAVRGYFKDQGSLWYRKSDYPVYIMKFLEMNERLTRKHPENSYSDIDSKTAYVKEIMIHLDPAAMDIVFNLSEKYSKMYFPSEDEKLFAKDLFDVCVKHQYPKALEKNERLETEKKKNIEALEKSKRLEKERKENLERQKREKSSNTNSGFSKSAGFASNNITNSNNGMFDDL